MRTFLLLLSAFVMTVGFITFGVGIGLEKPLILPLLFGILGAFGMVEFYQDKKLVLKVVFEESNKSEEIAEFNAKVIEELKKEKKQLQKEKESFSKWSDKKIEKLNEIIKKLRGEKNSLRSKLKYQKNKK